MSKIDQMLRIYNSEWRKVLAGRAIDLIAEDYPGVVEEFQRIVHRDRFDSLLNDLNSLDSEKNWKQYMEFLAVRIKYEFIQERNPENPRFTGEERTVIDHACDDYIQIGFVSALCADLDGGLAQLQFIDFLVLEKMFLDAMQEENKDIKDIKLGKILDKESEVLEELHKKFRELVIRMQELGFE